ncbi:MAG: hypothetical protein O2905_06030 [Proteobacteria bacterium]|nr:hypothetical protein [Pseudomonadota bacterium]
MDLDHSDVAGANPSGQNRLGERAGARPQFQNRLIGAVQRAGNDVREFPAAGQDRAGPQRMPHPGTEKWHTVFRRALPLRSNAHNFVPGPALATLIPAQLQVIGAGREAIWSIMWSRSGEWSMSAT